MAIYKLHVLKISDEVLKITIGRGDIAISAFVSGDEIAKWIMERGNLDENLMPLKEIQAAFRE